VSSKKPIHNAPDSTEPMTKAQLVDAILADDEAGNDERVILYVRDGDLGCYYQVKRIALSISHGVNGEEKTALVIEAGGLLSVG